MRKHPVAQIPLKTALAKVKAVVAAWITGDPQTLFIVYTVDSIWRNRFECSQRHSAIQGRLMKGLEVQRRWLHVPTQHEC